MKKSFWTIIFIVFTGILGLYLGNALANRMNKDQAVKDQAFMDVFKSMSRSGDNKINSLMTLLKDEYVDDLPLDSLTDDIMADILSKLDPHSVYIPAKDLEKVTSELEGSFGGVGIQFNIQMDTLVVVSVINGAPAERAGIFAGDRLVKVNDTLFVGKETVSNEKAMKKLRGKKGTTVKMTVKRTGTKELLDFEVERGVIPVNTVTVAYMIKPEIGFIGLNNNFGAKTYNEFIGAIAELKSKGAKRFIIDLRENSGGLMDVAIKMINEFLEKDELIVYSEGKAFPRSEARANGTGTCIANPLVVLIDEFSASASEIFAGAIQDNDRGVIVGRRSFGKGLVQTQIPFNDGSAVRLTVARYYTPTGRSIQKPYKIGKAKDYDMDILNRYEHGEFDNLDSIQMNDTIKYKTAKGKIVYGGGGIMPDVFVPRDTIDYTPYFLNVSNHGHTYQFAFRFTDQHRKRLNQLKSWQEIEAYLSNQDIIASFVNYAESKGVSNNPRELSISKQRITEQINGYIIRNILGDSEFYQYRYNNDKTVLRAIQEVNKI